MATRGARLFCVGQTATLTTNGANTYTWSTSTIASTETVSPSSNANYTVTGTDINNCIGSSIFTQSVSTCTGINNLVNNISGIFIFPNPTNGLSEVAVTTVESGNIVLKVFNLLGEEIREVASENSASGTHHFTLDTSDLANGIYYCQLITGTKKYVQKLIVAK